MRRAIGVLLALAVLAACSGDDDVTNSATTTMPEASEVATNEAVDEGARTIAQAGELTLETTSTRAEYVTGGDVLVTLSGAGAADATVTVNGADVSDDFQPAGDLRRAIVAGLAAGDNEIVATSGDDTVTLIVTNHSINGPIFSGPHLEPWVCKTEDAGLGAPLDEDCDAPATVTYSYVNTAGAVVPLGDPLTRPADLGTTPDGQPFIIRTEQGVINRGIYTVWLLDPNAGGGFWDSSAWNERLVYRFGGGCGTTYSQGSSFVGNADTNLLGLGYAVATNTLDTFQTACNDTLSAETALMTREYFIDHFGVPEFTIGDGGSGGAIQQLLIAQRYPGILDALSPSVPFPDAVSIAGGVTDCGLLVQYYDTEFGASLSDEQRRAINGQMSTGTCESWDRLFVGAARPSDGCDPALDDQVYDPGTRPDGVRCTLQDSNVNIVGVDSETGFANRPLDNVGVQYGLVALNDGVISVDEFLDLNEHIGGMDIDGNVVPERATASEEVMADAYRAGSVLGPGPAQDIPIVLRNLFTDDIGDIHTRFHAFSIRDRLGEDSGDDPNLLLWTAPSVDLVQQLLGNVAGANNPVILLDEWLTTGTKPAAALNRCVLADGTELTGGWELYDEPGPCAEEYPIFGDPRLAAGAPLANNVLKCALTDADPASYTVDFTPEQEERLRSVFPDGVCDWTQPGIGQQPMDGSWPSYGT